MTHVKTNANAELIITNASNVIETVHLVKVHLYAMNAVQMVNILTTLHHNSKSTFFLDSYTIR